MHGVAMQTLDKFRVHKTGNKSSVHKTGNKFGVHKTGLGKKKNQCSQADMMMLKTVLHALSSQKVKFERSYSN